MTYKTEADAVRRIWYLVHNLGVWPGYWYSRTARGWVLTYDPPVVNRAQHEGWL